MNPLRKAPIRRVAASAALFALLVPSIAGAAPPPPEAVSPEAVEQPTPAGSGEAQVDEGALRQGRIVRNSGIGFGALGVVMLGAFGALHAKYKGICSDTLGSEDLERSCDDSKRANITVAAMGVTFLVGGAVLIGLGQAKVKRAKQGRVALVPSVGRGTAGLTLVGRF